MRSSSFLSKIRQVMFRMFKYAKREGVIATNPADDLCPYCLRHTYGTMREYPSTWQNT